MARRRTEFGRRRADSLQRVTGLELILVLLVIVLIVVEASTKIGIPYPILLVLGGLLLAAIPGLPEVTLEPDIVLLVFLPPLLFIAAYLTPLRDLRANRRAIALLSVGLVLFTVTIVGLTAGVVIPELRWAAAFALGAIVAPTDAIAATSIFRRLNTPRRVITVLEGEALLNDAAALVAYRVAVVAALTGAFTPPRPRLTSSSRPSAERSSGSRSEPWRPSCSSGCRTRRSRSRCHWSSPMRPSCRPTGSIGRASWPLSSRVSSSAGGRRRSSRLTRGCSARRSGRWSRSCSTGSRSS